MSKKEIESLIKKSEEKSIWLMVYESTWLAKPIPNPRRIRPTMSIQTAWAKPFNKAPAQNSTPPISIDSFLPSFLVTVAATIEETSAAKYNDDVKMVSSRLSNLQYWFVEVSAFSFLYTAGKNSSKNESIDVTPPIMNKQNLIIQTQKIDKTHTQTDSKSENKYQKSRYRNRR